MSKFKAQYKNESDLTLSHLKIHNVGQEACDPLHSWSGVRDFYSIHTIESGRGCYILGKECFHLQAGDTFLVYPNTPVTYTADKKEPWSYLWLGISGILIENIIKLTNFTEENPCIYQKNQVDFKTPLLDIYHAQGTNYGSELEMIGLTYLFLSKLIPDDKKGVVGQGQHYAQKAKEFIDLNYSSGITPQQVADKLNISRSHLHRIFTSHFEISTGKYINKLRMDRASFLLGSSDLSILEISNSVGFENQLYFSNTFKKNIGTSPSNFRKQFLCKE